MHDRYGNVWWGLFITITCLKLINNLKKKIKNVILLQERISSPACRECEWTITAPQGQQVELNITSFDLENHTRCNYDYLEIRCLP